MGWFPPGRHFAEAPPPNRLEDLAIRIAVAFSAVVALAALAGWMFDIALLRSIVPGAVAMKANTAVGLLLDAMALLLLGCRTKSRVRAIGYTLACSAAALGLGTLFEYAYRLDLGIDDLLFHDASIVYSYPGRMSPFAAVAFVAIAVSLVPVVGTKSRLAAWLGGGIVLAIGAVSSLGYLWNARELTTDRLAPPVAINTAIVFVVLAFAALTRGHVAEAALPRRRDGPVSLETKIVVALCTVLLSMFVGAGWMYRSTARFDASMVEVARVQEIRTTLAQLYAEFSDAESAQRHYLLTSDDEQRDRYRRLSSLAAGQQARLAALVATDAEQRAVLVELDSSVARCFAILDLEIKRFEEGTFSTRAQLVTAGLSDPARTMARTNVDRMDALEAARQERLEAQATRIRQYTLSALLLMLAVASIFGVLLIRAVRAEMLVRQEVRRFDALGQRAMSLFTAPLSHQRAIGGTLQLIRELHTDSGVAFYAAGEDAGRLSRTQETGDLAALPSQIGSVGDTIDEAALRKYFAAQSAAVDANADDRAGRTAGSQVLACPVVYRDKILGVVAVSTPSPLPTHECAFVRRISGQLGATLHNLRQYSDVMKLSAELTGKNEALSRQAADLEKGARTKSEFLATMSHELRTPLNAIIGFAEVLHENLVGAVSEEQREYLGDILSSGEHLLELINDILDLSKVEAGKMVLRFEPVDVQPILDNALTMVRERAHSNRVRLAVDIDGELPALWLDSRRLKQILFNLLANAVKFTGEGGQVCLRARCTASDVDATLEVSVSDTGIGISQTDQARLFQPFVQIDSSLGKRFEGTGLGLAMVKRLAALHGGTASVHSVPGEGSTFSVSLPCRVAHPEDLHEAAPSRPAASPVQRSLPIPLPTAPHVARATTP